MKIVDAHFDGEFEFDMGICRFGLREIDWGLLLRFDFTTILTRWPEVSRKPKTWR